MDPHTSIFAAALLFLSSALMPALHDPTTMTTTTNTTTNITTSIPSAPRANVSVHSSPIIPLPSPGVIPPSLLQHRDIVVRFLTHTLPSSSSFNSSKQKYDQVLRLLSPDTTYPSPVSKLPAFAANPFMRDYLRTHAVAMRCIRSASCYHNATAAAAHPPLLVWACPARRCKGTGDRMRGILSALSVAVLSRRVFLVDWPDQPFPLVHAVAPGALDWRMPLHVRAHLHGSGSNSSNNSTREVRAPATWGRLDDYEYPMFKWSVCPGTYVCLNETSPSKTKTKMKGRRHEGEGEEQGNVISESFNISNIARVLQAIDTHVVLPTHGTYSSRLYRMSQWHTRVANAFRSTNADAKHKQRYVSPSPLDMHRMLLRILFRPSPVTAALLRDVVPYTTDPSPSSSSSSPEATKMNVQSRGKQQMNNSDAVPKTLLDTVRFEPYMAVHARTGRDVGERNMARFRGLRRLDAPALATRFARCVGHFDDVMSLLSSSSSSSIFPSLSPSTETLANNSSSNSSIKSTTAVRHIVFVSDSFDLKDAFASTMSNLSNANCTTATQAKKHSFTVHYSTYRGLHLSTPDIANVYAYANNTTTTGQSNNKVREEDVIQLLHDQRWLRFIHVFVDFFALANGTDVVANPSEFSRLAFTMSNARRYVTFNVTDDTAACAAVRRLGSMSEVKHSGVEALIYAKEPVRAKEKKEEAGKSE